LNGGYGWLEVICKRCETRASLPLDAIRRPRDAPIRKLETAFRCRSCGTPRYRPPVHMIRLTKEQSIAPYVWTHPQASAFSRPASMKRVDPQRYFMERSRALRRALARRARRLEPSW